MSMPKRNSDRRIQRTRLALISAFVELVLTRGYEALTTGEICRQANVGRSTFYLHFAGKKEILTESLQGPSNLMAACVGGDATPKELIPLLDHFREQRTLNRVFFVDPIRSLWVKNLADLIKPCLGTAPKIDVVRSDAPRALVALVIAEMQIAVITHSLKGCFSLKSELIAAMLVANTHAMLSAVGAQRSK